MTPTGLAGLAAAAVDEVAGPAAAWSAMSALPHPLTANAKAMMAVTVPADLVFMMCSWVVGCFSR